MALQVLEHRSGSATEFKYAPGLRIGLPDSLDEVFGRVGAIAHDRVVEFRENLIRRHVEQCKRPVEAGFLKRAGPEGRICSEGMFHGLKPVASAVVVLRTTAPVIRARDAL